MGGSWLAISGQGRIAAVTNFREMDSRDYPRSRGELPVRFLEAQDSASDFARLIHREGGHYAGFNALFYDGASLVYYSNRTDTRPQTLPAGQYGLSNHLLDTPWPKVRRAKEALRRLPEQTDFEQWESHLTNAMQDRTKAPDQELPNTGVGKAMEQLLSPVFIQSPSYGTRATSIISVEKEVIRFVEQGYDSLGRMASATRHTLKVNSAES